jgi:hypothetical protein
MLKDQSQLAKIEQEREGIRVPIKRQKEEKPEHDIKLKKYTITGIFKEIALMDEKEAQLAIKGKRGAEVVDKMRHHDFSQPREEKLTDKEQIEQNKSEYAFYKA